MHFRHPDDEILFGRLKAQLIQSLQGAPLHMLTNALRVLGRIESIAFYEGVRQGVVAQTICKEKVPPITLHSRVYAGAFTPLTDAEDQYVSRAGSTAEVLDKLRNHCVAEPLKMPPMTLAEALAAPTGSLAAARLAASANAANAANAAAFSAMDAATDSSPVIESGDDLNDFDSYLKGNGNPADTFNDVTNATNFNNLFGADVVNAADFNDLFGAADNSSFRTSLVQTDGSATNITQPSFIERCRDALQTRMQTGWGPANWADVVFAVRDELKSDAFAIDLNLSTDVGKSMLRSIGLFDIADALLDAETVDAMLRVEHSNPLRAGKMA